MNNIFIAGLTGGLLNRRHVELLERCCAVVAGREHISMLSGMTLEIIPMTPVEEMLDSLHQALQIGDCMVLASGDPFFFGIGRRLVERFGSERIMTFPALSSMQMAAARFCIPWDDMKFISLHGRNSLLMQGNMLLTWPKISILTDSHHTPTSIARHLIRSMNRNGLAWLASNINIHVAERLGFPDEKLFSGHLDEAASIEFAHPNIVILTRSTTKDRNLPIYGLQSSGFVCRNNLITKDEIRAVTLHKLSLPESGVMWDIGAGSGSVSIEAARSVPGLFVCAVEKDRESASNIMQNINKYKVFNIELTSGEAPEALRDLPEPDRIFIGGSGGRLDEIIMQASSALKKGGVIVVNAVLETTARRAPELMRSAGFSVEISRISVEHIMENKDNRQVNILNPITIVKGSL